MSSLYKITPSWQGSAPAGTSVKYLFSEGNMVYFQDEEDEVRVLSSLAFKNIFTNDIKRVDPFLPYGYAWPTNRSKYSIQDYDLPTVNNTIWHRLKKAYYKSKKFIRGT